MMADIPLAKRAVKRIRQSVQAGIGIGMALQPARMRDFDAAQHDMIAGHQGMDVKALSGPGFHGI